MTNVYLSLGSNVGHKEQNVKKAISAMRAVKSIKVLKTSHLYKTKSWGYEKQQDFINAAIKIKADLSPNKLFAILKCIEAKLGRRPQEIKWGPRVIDIDILLYGSKILNNPRLKIPHPHMQERLFVLQPLAEIAPRLVHPKLKRTIKKLIKM